MKLVFPSLLKLSQFIVIIHNLIMISTLQQMRGGVFRDLTKYGSLAHVSSNVDRHVDKSNMT